MKQQKQTEKGFTIIEVVLVLAIAGLIFLMVFIALPALQRNQRDTQRREDASRFMSQIEQYRTNNRGAVPEVTEVKITPGATPGDPPTGGSFISNYMKDDFKDPSSGEMYTFVGTVAEVEKGKFTYATSRVCSGENMVSTGASSRQAAIVMGLEGSGNYCQNN